jgi:16S rRNA (guanine527-N7)-methyltransferase
VDTSRIAELLVPFAPPHQPPLGAAVLADISMYIDVLVKWNARINLTAVRAPEEIVTRHFGESLFAAVHLFPGSAARASLVDVGSGAGFPGVPIKLWAPGIKLTLVESRQKKATFLREVCRILDLSNAEVFAGRAQDLPSGKADVVTLRAVESFESALPAAVRLLRPDATLALLVGAGQVPDARQIAPDISWNDPIPIPQSSRRVLLMGSNRRGNLTI